MALEYRRTESEQHVVTARKSLAAGIFIGLVGFGLKKIGFDDGMVYTTTISLIAGLISTREYELARGNSSHEEIQTHSSRPPHAVIYNARYQLGESLRQQTEQEQQTGKKPDLFDC
jgi:hypothetical protein